MKKNPFDLHSEEYEEWFSKNRTVFLSELSALQRVIPMDKKGMEIGVGTGVFAEKLGISHGLEPSDKMADFARKRGIAVKIGFAENLPYQDAEFDFVLFNNSLCFVKNPEKSIKEASRILRPGGKIIIGILDKDSYMGKRLQTKKKENKFYQNASFFSSADVLSLLERFSFRTEKIYQTLFPDAGEMVEIPQEGHGQGGFVVITGSKSKN